MKKTYIKPRFRAIEIKADVLLNPQSMVSSQRTNNWGNTKRQSLWDDDEW